MGRRKRNTNEAFLNNTTYLNYYYRLKELGINMMQWEGLPESVDERFLELTLFEKGYCLYFRDEIMGDLALPCTIGGRLNVYNIPTMRRAYSTSGYQKQCDMSDSVIIFNNYLHTSTEMVVRMYAYRLYNLERTIDVNVNAQKTPIILKSSESQRLTMQNMMLKYDGNTPFIFADDKMLDDRMEVLDTKAPFVSDKLQIMKNQIWNEALTFFGIENSNQDKRERLVADEVGSNYGHVEAEREIMLNSRKRAAEEINRMFGTELSVSFRSNLDTKVNRATGYTPEPEVLEEGEEG